MQQEHAIHPLDDLRVVELGCGIGGAFCGKLLAGLGAEVVKVEPPSGDATRSLGPFVAGASGPEISLLFMYLNTGKQGVTLAPESPTGRALLAQLVNDADVVLDSLGPGRLGALGLPAEHIAALNPATIVVFMSPFGDVGPYSSYLDSELVVLALGGLLNMVGYPDREPVRLGGYQSEYQAGTAAFTGLLAALHSRDRDGLGQRVEIAAQETVAFTEWKSAIYYQATGQLRQRGGVLSQWVVLPCSDGFAAFVYQDGDWPRVVTLIQDERLTDDRFLTRRGRLTFADELRGNLQAWTCQRTKLEVYHTAQTNGVPVGMVADMADVLDSPQYRDRQFFDRIDHPSTGIAEYPGLPVRFNGERPRTTRAPLLGEHNRVVYEQRLGFDEQTVTRLRERGII